MASHPRQLSAPFSPGRGPHFITLMPAGEHHGPRHSSAPAPGMGWFIISVTECVSGWTGPSDLERQRRLLPWDISFGLIYSAFCAFVTELSTGEDYPGKSASL